MGSYIGIGYKRHDNDSGIDNLSVVLHRTASNAIEVLLDEVLQDDYSKIHEKIMEVLALDQINFIELDKDEFNTAVKAVRNYLANYKEPTERQLYQKRVWEEEIEPLVVQDERYNLN